MRLSSAVVVTTGALLVLVACSSSSGSTGGANPENDGGSSSGTTSSGGSSGGSSGSNGGPGDVVKTTTEVLDHEGAQRKYVLSVPTDYDATKKYPLVFWLHGHPGSAEVGAGFQVHNVTKNEAIIAYPGALAGNWDHQIAISDNADGTFILKVIDEVSGKYNVDGGRVFISGWSGGAFMASSMACRYSAKFRAIGIHAGGAPYDLNNPNGTPDCNGAAVAAIVTHGEADTTVPFDGGKYAGQYWSEHNGCGGTKTASTPAPCETYDGCPAAKPVKTCFIPGLGHPLWDQVFTVEWAFFKGLP